MEAGQAPRVLKRDVFGTVERVLSPRAGPCVLRRAMGSRLPGSRFVARRLLERERRALRVLAGLPGVPRLVEGESAASDPRRELVRSWIPGVPLSEATALPEDYFDELDRLVARIHARGVCHNDLHKEQNVLVRADGRPALVDFQLASCHALGSRTLAARAREDFRHVEKHRGRYTRHGRGPRGARTFGRGAGTRRSLVAFVWRRFGKPVYLLLTRVVFRARDGEARRPSSGPWPVWTAPVGDARARATPERG